METKTCRICNAKKQTKEFSFRKDTNKFRTECKECEKLRKRKYYEDNLEKIKARSHNFYYDNLEKNKKQRKMYREENKEEIKKNRAKYYQENKQMCIKKSKEYYEKNKERVLERAKNYYIKNKKSINTYKNCRKKVDELYKLKCNIRNILYQSFKRKNDVKKGSCERILGCNIDFFVEYLLQTYKNNYGYEWDGIEPVHIDHIKPLCFANTKSDIYNLCRYTNLQLLKAKDNLRKGTKTNYTIKGE